LLSSILIDHLHQRLSGLFQSLAFPAGDSSRVRILPDKETLLKE
jgi:hypothetical protein